MLLDTKLLYIRHKMVGYAMLDTKSLLLLYAQSDNVFCKDVAVQTSLYCAAMRETVAINTNFSFLVAVQVQDITFLLTVQQRSGNILTS